MLAHQETESVRRIGRSDETMSLVSSFSASAWRGGERECEGLAIQWRTRNRGCVGSTRQTDQGSACPLVPAYDSVYERF